MHGEDLTALHRCGQTLSEPVQADARLLEPRGEAQYRELVRPPCPSLFTDAPIVQFSTYMMVSYRFLLIGICLLIGDLAAAAEPAALPEAWQLYWRGNYVEADENFAALTKEAPVDAALGRARCAMSQGQDAAAVKLLESVEKHQEQSRITSLLAELAYQHGDLDQAQTLVDETLKLDPKAVTALWLAAELQRRGGHLDKALAGYRELVKFYNENDITAADDLRAVGLAAAQYARWERLHDQFGFLVNTLYPATLESNADFWPADYDTGLLFLEKYNEAEAKRSFQAALKKNPRAAEVHAALAHLALQNFDMDDAERSFEQALEINPRLVSALQAKADWLTANFEEADAIKLLQETRKLDPTDEGTLGRLAALYILRDGRPENPVGTPLGDLMVDVALRNPQAGEFYYVAAGTLSLRRKFDDAEPLLRTAIERMPQLVGPRSELGLLYMRVGREVEAEKLLKESFEIDPFNVRVNNMLKVLEVLSTYAVLETEHFLIKFDRGQDEIFAKYAAAYLEDEVYPELCRTLDYKPEGKSLFEFFNRARNTNGHGWFSARMVGLPYIGTVGACAGKMVAMTSPNSMEQKFNWARVLKHEFVHVVNLQQTRFNVPHWFTEALAVHHEGYPRLPSWNRLLAARLAADELFNLDTINLGFVRPKSSDDWTLAYCQSELYAEYLLATYGDDALSRMLAAYADNLSTEAALEKLFGVKQQDFEVGYLAYLHQVVEDMKLGASTEEAPSLDKAVAALEADPENPDRLADVAWGYLQRKSYPNARKLALAATEQEPKHPLGLYVLARLDLLIGDAKSGVLKLREGLDPQDPDRRVLELLAAIYMKAGATDQAATLYKLGQEHFPGDERWRRALAAVYLRQKDYAQLSPLLVDLAALDPDDVSLRKKLAEIALEEKDFAAAEHWANQANQIDVLDPAVHRLWAEALVGLAKWTRAADEYRVAVRLAPRDADLQVALAETLVAAQQPAEAREVLDKLLERQPDHPQAVRLREKLAP